MKQIKVKRKKHPASEEQIMWLQKRKGHHDNNLLQKGSKANKTGQKYTQSKQTLT